MTVPLDFLQTASRTSLEGFELNRLAHATVLRKQIVALLEQWIEDREAAGLARLLIENEALRSISLDPLQEAFDFADGGVGGPPAQTDAPKRVPINQAAD
jgi:hypothetical protein